MYLFSTFKDTSQNPFKIDSVDGILACKLRFSYGQRSKCADLVNIQMLWIFTERIGAGL